jgi:hypothetical protein
MSENRITQTWGIGNLRIAEWENFTNHDTKYLSYSINKTEYERPKIIGEKGTYKNIFSLSILRKEELIIILNLIKRRINKQPMNGYSLAIKTNDNPLTPLHFFVSINT